MAGDERVPEGKVAQSRVALEDGDHANEERRGKERVITVSEHSYNNSQPPCYLLRKTEAHAPERDAQWRDVRERVELEDAEEEGAEVVKHLDEKVPVQANVGRQVWRRQTMRWEGPRSARLSLVAKGQRDAHDSVDALEEEPVARDEIAHDDKLR